MEHAADPWFIAMMITLILGGLFTAYALRTYVRDFLIIAIALPQALFKKAFGDPPDH